MISNWIDSISLGGIVSIRDALLEQQANGKKIFRLESGDPSFDISVDVVDAIRNAVIEGRTHYTAGAGIKELREEIAKKLTEKNNINTTMDNVFVTNGAMHALYVTFKALVESEHDEFIVPVPTWTETADNVTMVGGRPMAIPLSSYVSDLSEIEYNIKPWTVAIVLNSPHNPTGTVLTQTQIEDIVELARKYNLWLISDEAYEDIIYDDVKHFSPGSIYDKTISIYSFSKSYAMSGLRLGYLNCNDRDIADRIKKLLRCTINGVNSLAQYAGLGAIRSPDEYIKYMMMEYSDRRSILCNALLKSPSFNPRIPDGAFYVWCKIEKGAFSGLTDWQISDMLAQEHGIGSAPGSIFGIKSNLENRFLRFAFSCPTEHIKGASEILSKL